MSLLERFQADTVFDSHGQFSLDESKAREKMARFQLVSNEEFLMLVAQAAVASQCTKLAVTLEGSRIQVVAKEALWDAEALGILEEFLLDSQPENVAYNLLAVAVNAIEPACIEPPFVAMIEGDLHFKLELKTALPHLSVMLKERLSHLPCPLILNGETLPTDPINGESRVELTQEEASSITLVRYGVIVARKAKSFPIDFQATASADHLRLDASFSHVVEDEAYHSLTQELSKKANRLLADIAQGYQPGGSERTVLLSHFMAMHERPAGKALEACPFFPLADRPDYWSFSKVLDRVQVYGHVLVSSRSYNLQLPSPVLRLDDPELRQALYSRLPATAFQDADKEYLAQSTAQKNRERWDSSPRPTELPPGPSYLCEKKVKGRGWEAAIGLLGPPGGGGRADVLYLGKLLASETLEGSPPGATAVLNVTNAQVDASWSRLEGREYRRVLKALQEQLRTLFLERRAFKAEELYPELSEYLLAELASRDPSEVARKTPLFPVIGEKAVFSLEQLKNAGATVSIGEKITLSDKIALTALPSPMVLYSPERLQALKKQLGAKGFFDARELQQRLLEIEKQMDSPLPATLKKTTKFLRKRAFSYGNCQGELALLEEFGAQTKLTLLKQGVAFETRQVTGGKVFASVAIVDVPEFELVPAWTGFVHDAAYRSLLLELQSATEELEKELLLSTELEARARLKLLQAYPQPRERVWDWPLFPSTVRTRLYSLSELAKELEEHGSLLRGESGVIVPHRLALERPGKDALAFLESCLGGILWREAEVVLRDYRAAQDFEKRRVHQKVTLVGAYPVLLGLPEGRGEIALSLSQDQEFLGKVSCYVRGRFVCDKKGVIPAPFVAAIEDSRISLNRDFRDVTIPSAVTEMLQQLATQCMLEAATHKFPEVRELAWGYFRNPEAPQKARQQFAKIIRLETLDGQGISLEELLKSRVYEYVGPKFRLANFPQRPILRMEEREAARLSRFLKRKLENKEASLRADEAYYKKLEALPTKLPSSLYQRTFQDSTGKAVLGVSLQRLSVGLDEEGRPVGYLRRLRLPVQAFVYGASGLQHRKDVLEASIDGKLNRQLNSWAEQLCLLWVKERGDNRELLLELLYLSLRELPSLSANDAEGSPVLPSAEMAGLLWDMPLFSRADGTRVSGSALATALSETGKPLLVTHTTFRAPSAAISFPAFSKEEQILEGALGKRSLEWFEAPPLLDVDEIGRSVKRLVSWGLSPIGKTFGAVEGFLQRHAAREKAKAAKPSAREMLVSELKEDVRNLLGRDHYRRSNLLFRHLDFGRWPLGPPIYQPRSGEGFRLNALHPGIRWLLEEDGDKRAKRAARMMLLVHWVGLVNVASEELQDAHEGRFLSDLADRMRQTFSK